MIDPLATMTPEEYRKVRDQLRAEGLWQVSDDPRREARSNQRAAEYLLRDLRSDPVALAEAFGTARHDA